MEKELKATYDSDSKRYHRFIIDEGQGLTGTIYIPKEGAVPNSVTIRLRTKAEAEQERN